jgi:hypothetical protein
MDGKNNHRGYVMVDERLAYAASINLVPNWRGRLRLTETKAFIHGYVDNICHVFGMRSNLWNWCLLRMNVTDEQGFIFCMSMGFLWMKARNIWKLVIWSDQWTTRLRTRDRSSGPVPLSSHTIIGA